MNARRPLPFLLSCLLLTGSLWGCQPKAAEEEEKGTSSESSESSTEDIFSNAGGGSSGSVEERGRELQDRAGEIRSMEGSEQEKIDAVMEFEEEREKLNEEAGVR